MKARRMWSGSVSKVDIDREKVRVIAFCIDLTFLRRSLCGVHYSRMYHRFQLPNYWYQVDELFPLQRVAFEDMYIMAPKTPLPYLRRCYGDDWNVPKFGMYTLE
jgi:hypothetical protein